MYVYICMYISLYIYICIIYIYTHIYVCVFQQILASLHGLLITVEKWSACTGQLKRRLIVSCSKPISKLKDFADADFTLHQPL